jgi:hypothetical protein
MDPLESARQHLASPTRQAFLATLAHLLTLTARTAYPEAGATPQQTTTGLRCHNELLHTILGQLAADLDQTPSYPDGVFLAILIQTADQYRCGAALHWALQTASNQTTKPGN